MSEPQHGSFDPVEATERLQGSPLHRFLGFSVTEIGEDTVTMAMPIDPNAFVFMNTDASVHLHRAPLGNDFALRARGSIGPDGIGVTTAEIFDRDGFIGTSAQTLLVQRR